MAQRHLLVPKRVRQQYFPPTAHQPTCKPPARRPVTACPMTMIGLPLGAGAASSRPRLLPTPGATGIQQHQLAQRPAPQCRQHAPTRTWTCSAVPSSSVAEGRPFVVAPSSCASTCSGRRAAAAASSASSGPAAPPPPPPPPPPYSQLSVPVYSLATVGREGGGSSATMNLMIYASPISLTPRHYAIGLYQNTLSRENMLATRRGVLQILGEQHAQLFQLLGKTSGRDVDKLARLGELGFATQDWRGIPTLADCCGFMELEFAAEPFNAGDHEVAICRVVDYQTVAADAKPLYTGYLREIGVY